MRVRVIQTQRPLKGVLVAPGDKSISHRALLFSALSQGGVEVFNLAPGADVRSTATCLRSLGADLHIEGLRARVRGQGLLTLRSPARALDCGNSGTTMRLLSGVVAGAKLEAVLDGDASLRQRPMRRVLAPLRAMGAKATGVPTARGDEGAPLRFEHGHPLMGWRHELAVASAQVKSCLLLAGLWANGVTEVREPSASRDHTERMLAAAGAPLERAADGALRISRPSRPLLMPKQLHVPGDPSSAAFLAAAASLVPGSEVEIQSVCANPTRLGFFRAMTRMGGNLDFRPQAAQAGEEVAHVTCRHGELRATDILPSEIPALIDEVPILSVVATQARGTTTVRGASELRHKESDRIAQLVSGLRAMGAHADEFADGLAIHGPVRLRGASIDSMGDHRIAMSFAVAGLLAEGETIVEGAEWADISFPGFFDLLSQLTGSAQYLPSP